MLFPVNVHSIPTSISLSHKMLRLSVLSSRRIIGPSWRKSMVRSFSTSILLRNATSKVPISTVPKTDLEIARSRFTEGELEAARVARLAGLKWLTKLPEKWIPYAELMRLEKPAGSLLLLIPSLWGITMAAYSVSAPIGTTISAIGLFSIGAIIMRGAGCTINDILDRNLDNQVARTMERPITSGRVKVPQAVGWLSVQCFAGLGVLLALPADCFFLGALSLPFIATYPLFKRFTYYPQAWLSICYSWGCLLGFPAVGAPLNLLVAAPLFISNWIWCVTYDTIYAHQDKVYDVQAGIKSTALAWGENTKPILRKLTYAQAGFYYIAGIANSMGPGFYISGTWALWRLYNTIRDVDLDDQKSCWAAFTGNIATGFFFWYGMMFDYVLQVLGFI